MNGTLRSDQATLDLSGASAVDLIDNVTNLTADASGASKANLPDLAVQMLSIDLSGASSAVVAVSGTISADVSGASRLRYGGNPTFTHRSETGASTIEPLHRRAWPPYLTPVTGSSLRGPRTPFCFRFRSGNYRAAQTHVVSTVGR